MTRALSALLLALGLLLTGACSDGSQSGDSNPDSQVDEVPAEDGDQTSEEETDE
jgi:hypothetical protein